MSDRMAQCWAQLKKENRTAFIAFVTAGHPDLDTTARILDTLVAAGVDIIEIGFPFSDPIGEGPTIQLSSEKAIQAGATLPKVLALVTQFRERHPQIPVVLMGYYNPVYVYGADAFLRDAAAAGADATLVVDIPFEHDDELVALAASYGIHPIRLITPTTSPARIQHLLTNASGFLYYVSIAGVTGTQKPDVGSVQTAVQEIKRHTDLPVVVGFGIRTQDDVRAFSPFVDGVVVGSQIVRTIETESVAGKDIDTILNSVHQVVTTLKAGLSTLR